jgi:hypothetical protein
MKRNDFIEMLKAKKAEKMGKVINKSQPSDEDLSLPELRDKYPKVKARSKDDFLKKLNEK